MTRKALGRLRHKAQYNNNLNQTTLAVATLRHKRWLMAVDVLFNIMDGGDRRSQRRLGQVEAGAPAERE
eukprot:SAG22_NODE_5656_length_976_cov_2.490308_2_plen_68_part_01